MQDSIHIDRKKVFMESETLQTQANAPSYSELLQKVNEDRSSSFLALSMLGSVITMSQTAYVLVKQTPPIYADRRRLSRLDNFGYASSLLLNGMPLLVSSRELVRRAQTGESLAKIRPSGKANTAFVATAPVIIGVTIAEAVRGKTLVKGRKLSKYGKAMYLFAVARAVAQLGIHFRELTVK